MRLGSLAVSELSLVVSELSSLSAFVEFSLTLFSCALSVVALITYSSTLASAISQAFPWYVEHVSVRNRGNVPQNGNF